MRPRAFGARVSANRHMKCPMSVELAFALDLSDNDTPNFFLIQNVAYARQEYLPK